MFAPFYTQHKALSSIVEWHAFLDGCFRHREIDAKSFLQGNSLVKSSDWLKSRTLSYTFPGIYCPFLASGFARDPFSFRNFLAFLTKCSETSNSWHILLMNHFSGVIVSISTCFLFVANFHFSLIAFIILSVSMHFWHVSFLSFIWQNLFLVKIICSCQVSNAFYETFNFFLVRVTIWDKVFKNEPSKICGRRSLKNLKRYGLYTKQDLD